MPAPDRGTQPRTALPPAAPPRTVQPGPGASGKVLTLLLTSVAFFMVTLDASNATLAVTTTQAETPAVNTVVNTTGIDDYMAGLESFVKSVTPGSFREIAALGDNRNALLMFTVEADYGSGRVTLASSRLYLLDEDRKITAEQVVYFVTS